MERTFNTDPAQAMTPSLPRLLAALDSLEIESAMNDISSEFDCLSTIGWLALLKAKGGVSTESTWKLLLLLAGRLKQIRDYEARGLRINPYDRGYIDPAILRQRSGSRFFQAIVDTPQQKQDAFLVALGSVVKDEFAKNESLGPFMGVVNFIVKRFA